MKNFPSFHLPLSVSRLLVAVLGLLSTSCYQSQSQNAPPPDVSQAIQTVPAAATDPLEVSSPDEQLAATDWTHWRGPEYNGISRATGLIDDWDPSGDEGSHVLWKRDDLGGRSTPIVMDGKLFTILRAEPGTEREGERVVCVDIETGETIWENRFNVWLSDVPDTRVGWSSCVGDPETGHVYALGVCGYFQCLDAKTGRSVWAVPLHEKFGLLSTYGGRTNFPVICDDLVIISAIVIGWGEMAKPAHRFLAFDKRTGDVVWFKGTRLLPYDTTYSTPTITVLAGQKAMVFGSGDGAVWALQPRTGLPIWNYRFSRRGVNVSPLVVGDRVLAAHSEENIVGNTMGAVAAIDGTGKGDVTDSHELWWKGELMVGKSSPIMIDDRLYCFDDRAKLHVLDAESGEQIGRKISLGTVMRASPLYADGKIYAITANGRWYILRPDPRRGAQTVSKGRLLNGEECHASPVCAGGSVFVQTTGHLYCLRDEDKQPGTTPAPPVPSEVSVDEDQQVAHVQIVPAEVLIKPGQKQIFSARLFNSRGQFLRDADADFTVQGPGQISATGEFTAPEDAGHVACTVVASVGQINGHARLRIVPPLPWEFDFEDVELDPRLGKGEPNVTWVGARYRHVIREVDGNKVMVKVTTIPKGTRSRCWFGHPELSQYSIQADVRGARTDNKMPDIGLIAMGYTLELQGANQKLQIRSWVPQLRMASTVEFPWNPDSWYTMKLRAMIEDGQAVLRGKVWLRDEPEPNEWTVEAVDKSPNLAGSPGLFGSAKDAEISLDNIRVFSLERD